MQSTRKPSSTLPHIPQTSIENPAKKKCSSTQTDSAQSFCVTTQLTEEEFKSSYENAVYFLNRCHEIMNQTLMANSCVCGDSQTQDKTLFRIPNIPNYYVILALFLEKAEKGSKKPILQESFIGDNYLQLFAENVELPEMRNVDKKKFEEYITKNNNLGPDYNIRNTEVPHSENLNQKHPLLSISGKCSKNKIANEHITSNRLPSLTNFPITSTLIKTDENVTFTETTKDLARNLIEPEQPNSPNECCAKLENVKFSCVDKKALMDLVQKQVREELNEILSTMASEKSLSHDQMSQVSTRTEDKCEICNIELEEFSSEDLDLMAYSLRTIQNKEECSRFAAENEILNCFGMFNDNGCNIEPTKNQVSKTKESTFFNEQTNQSDSDSVIFDDDEFERRVQNRTWDKNSKLDSFTNESMWNPNYSDSQSDDKPTKLHPLQLSNKDLNLADERMLKAIGLFTEKGDIRPEVIDLLEEKEQKSNKHRYRNKQFRTRRKLDVEIHFKPNRNIEKSSSISDGSLSDSQRSVISVSNEIPIKSENDVFNTGDELIDLKDCNINVQ